MTGRREYKKEKEEWDRRAEGGWSVMCSRREKIKWKRYLWDQVKWSGHARVRERLKNRQNTARPDHHKRGERRRERKEKRWKLHMWSGNISKGKGHRWMYGSCEVEIRGPWLLNDDRQATSSQRSHTHSYSWITDVCLFWWPSTMSLVISIH